MGRVQRVSDLDSDRQQSLNVQLTAPDAMFQRDAVEKLHRDESLPLGLTDVVDGADIRMVQCGSGLCFALEACQGLGILGDLVGQEFERDKAMQPGVLGLVDDSHAAATELFDDAVVRDGLANHCWESALGEAY